MSIVNLCIVTSKFQVPNFPTTNDHLKHKILKSM
jgi:hypothetical protein